MLKKEMKNRTSNRIYICVDTDMDKICNSDMNAYFEAVPYITKNHAILMKLFSEFYGILFAAMQNGETIFKPEQLVT